MYGSTLNLTEVSVSGTEVLTTAQLKTHLNVTSSDDDTYIGELLTAARVHVETITGRSLVDRTLRLDLHRFYHGVVLPKAPVISVESVKYYDANNALQTVSSSVYEVNLPGRELSIAHNQSWPSHFDRRDAVQINYTVGYGLDSSPVGSVPEPLLHAIKLLVGDMYENREARSSLRIEDNPTLDRQLAPYILGF